MVPFSRLTSSRYSVSPSQTARWLSRVTLRPSIWPEMRRLRSPSTWSIAAATRGQHCARSPSGAMRMEAVGEFLGDEAGREFAGAPARMRHQRRQERNIVADAVDDEGVERVGLRVDRLLRAWRAWVTSLAIIGS